MATTSRQVIVGDTIILEIDIRDATGSRADADSIPEVAIVDSEDAVLRARSSANVVRIDEGRYRLAYLVPGNGHVGIWTDHWYATLNGFDTEARLNKVDVLFGSFVSKLANPYAFIKIIFPFLITPTTPPGVSDDRPI